MSELRTILRHASTVLVGQLAVMAFGVADTIVAGRHSEQALAALSVGSAIFVSVYVGLMGVIQALMPVWSELRGAQQAPAVGRSVRQALYLCATTMVLGMAALMFPAPLLRWTQVPAALQADVNAYLGILAWGLPPALLFRLYSTLNQSLGYPQLVTWLQIGALGIKVPLTLWFALGGWGMEAHGAPGCAWATLVVNYGLCLLGFWLLRTQPRYHPYRLWAPMERPDRLQLAAFARLGVPAGLSIMVEVTSFTLMALFIARQGSLASAGHQIASNLAAVLYMVPLSLAIATSARASYWLGAAQPRLARSTIRTGMRLAILLAAVMASLLFSARTVIAGWYTQDANVALVASGLLVWVSLFHLADAVQAMCTFVLRCYRVTIAPLLTYCALLWGIGLGGGAVLAYRGWGSIAPRNDPGAFWITGSSALALTALIMAWLLWRTMAQQRRPAVLA